MAKTLFKSSEKSNFILNMTEDQYAKLASVGLIAACVMTSIFTAVPTVSETATYTFSAAGLAVSGVICMILAMIALIKKYIKGVLVLPTVAFAAMLLWGAVSLIFSYDYNVSIYGFPQRGEGLLALAFYFCIFVTAASIRRTKAISALLIGIVGAGLLNSIWALIQIFFEKLSHTPYLRISPFVNTAAASGLSQSPIFLAMVLSLALTVVSADSVLTSSTKRRVFDIVCMAHFSFVAMFTHTVMGILAIVFGIIAVIAAVVKIKADKKLLLSILAIVLAALGAFIIGSTAKKDVNGKYALHDGYILWYDDAYQRVDASGLPPANRVDISSPLDVYTYLNGETLEIIKKYPLTGTGPEQLVYPQYVTDRDWVVAEHASEFAASNQGTFDKNYNEYLYTAATRGIPSLIALIIILWAVVSAAKKDIGKKAHPAKLVAFMLTVCGILAFVIGCSNITFSPIFWACAGAACAQIPKNEKNPEGASEKKKPAKGEKKVRKA